MAWVTRDCTPSRVTWSMRYAALGLSTSLPFTHFLPTSSAACSRAQSTALSLTSASISGVFMSIWVSACLPASFTNSVKMSARASARASKPAMRKAAASCSPSLAALPILPVASRASSNTEANAASIAERMAVLARFAALRSRLMGAGLLAFGRGALPRFIRLPRYSPLASSSSSSSPSPGGSPVGALLAAMPSRSSGVSGSRPNSSRTSSGVSTPASM